MVVQLGEQHAAVVEQVSEVDVAVEVTDVATQPRVQLSVDVKLPGNGRLLNLQKTHKMGLAVPHNHL